MINEGVGEGELPLGTFISLFVFIVHKSCLGFTLATVEPCILKMSTFAAFA